MVKIPRKSALGRSQLSSQAPAFKQQPGSLSRTSQATQGLLQKTAEVAQVFEDIQTLNEQTKAKTIALQRHAGFEERALTQEDPSDTSWIRDEYNKAKNETAKGIGLPNARNEYEANYDGWSLLSQSKVNNILRKRLNQETILSTIEASEGEKDKFTLSNDPREQATIMNASKESFRKLVRAGLIKAKEAGKQINIIDKEWPIADIDQGIEDNLDFTIEQLEKGEEGIYKNVDSGVRLKKLGDAKKIKTKKQAQRKLDKSVEMEDAEEKTTNLLGEGKMTIPEIDRLAVLGESENLSGGISSSYAIAARRALTSPKSVTAVDDPATYALLKDRQRKLGIDEKDDISNAPFSEIAKYRADVINAQSDGKLTPTTARTKFLDVIAGSYAEGTTRIVRQRFRNGKIANGFFDNRFNTLGLTDSEKRQASMEVDKQLTEKLMKKDIPENELPELVQTIFKNWVREKRPSFLGLEDIPNATNSKDEELDVIIDGKTAVKATFKYNPKTGKVEKI